MCRRVRAGSIGRMLAASILLLAAARAAAPAVSAAPSITRYDLKVRLEPASHLIGYGGTLTAPGGAAKQVHGEKTINHPIVQEGEDYARGFAETEGTIQEEGVFLSGSSGWYPAPEKGSLVTFSLDVTLPAGW